MNSKIKQSWLQLTSIQVGGVICLPMLMIGQELGATYGLAQAIGAVIIGNALLLILGLLKASMSYENKGSTIESAMNYFGSYGIKLLALSIVVSMAGWFAIQLNLISLSVQTSIALISGKTVSAMLLNIVLGIVITICALFGINALNRLSDLSMPILLTTIAYTVYSVCKTGSVPIKPVDHSFKGISLVLAASIAAIIDMPTYYRFARSKLDSLISILLVTGVAIPAIEIAGIYIAHYGGGTNIIETLTNGGTIIYQLWILAFLVLAGWTTNNANIYSAAVTAKQLLPQASYTIRTLLLGLLATLASCFDLLSNLEGTLNGMGILISAMGAVIATQYALQKIVQNYQTNTQMNLLSWVIGSLFGFLCFFNIITLTRFDIIDTFFITMCYSFGASLPQIVRNKK